MAGEDTIFSVDQDGVGEAEATNALGDLPSLLTRMGSGVARPRPQIIKGNGFKHAGGHQRLAPDSNADSFARTYRFHNKLW
jgi:hypothetical protein